MIGLEIIYFSACIDGGKQICSTERFAVDVQWRTRGSQFVTYKKDQTVATATQRSCAFVGCR